MEIHSEPQAFHKAPCIEEYMEEVIGMTPKHQKIADDMKRAFEKVANCNHSVELVMKHKQLFSRCVKCGAMWKMKEGEKK